MTEDLLTYHLILTASLLCLVYVNLFIEPSVDLVLLMIVLEIARAVIRKYNESKFSVKRTHKKRLLIQVTSRSDQGSD